MLACVILLVGLLAASVFVNVRLVRLVFDVEDAVDDALAVCDATYSSVSSVLELPIMLDTPEVVHVVGQMKGVRDVVLHVANVLAAPFGRVEEEEEDGSGKEEA